VTRPELIQYLASRDRYLYTEAEDGSLIVADLAFDPPEESRLTDDGIAGHDLTTIVTALAHGRDVDHISRVTGYFSKTSQWNKGKQAELKDRHRTKIGGTDGRG
jgi:hypothetical protein